MTEQEPPAIERRAVTIEEGRPTIRPEPPRAAEVVEALLALGRILRAVAERQLHEQPPPRRDG